MRSNLSNLELYRVSWADEQYANICRIIATSVTQAKGSVSATALIQIEAAITTNLGAIVSALVAAESTISAATISGVTASTTAVSGLVQSDINTLESDVDLLITCIQNIHTTITAIVNVGGNVRLLAKAELTVLKATIQPFVNPLQVYVAAVLTSYAKAGVTVSGLTTAQTDLKTAISSLASTAL